MLVFCGYCLLFFLLLWWWFLFYCFCWSYCCCRFFNYFVVFVLVVFVIIVVVVVVALVVVAETYWLPSCLLDPATWCLTCRATWSLVSLKYLLVGSDGNWKASCRPAPIGSGNNKHDHNDNEGLKIILMMPECVS